MKEKLKITTKKELENKKKASKGITLIALVITIIVLLILAGVSIATLTGDNGILTQANNAKNENIKGQEKEAIGLAWQSLRLDRQASNTTDPITDTELKEQLVTNGEDSNNLEVTGGTGKLTVKYKDSGNSYTIDQNGNIENGTEDGNGGDTGDGEDTTPDGVPVPKGFYYVGGTKEEGVVISDNPADKDKGTSHDVATKLVGNQFVWVPVENDEDFKTYEGYFNKKLDTKLPKCAEPNVENGYEAEEAEYNAMKTSVLEHNGFYVARYEASKDETDNTKVASKQGKDVWNKIPWGNSMTDIGTKGAVYKSKQMYTDKNTYGVTSTLMYGVQWDAIMAWIDPAYKTGTCDVENSFVANSTGKGNYSNSLQKTGSNSNYAVKNIYDLAGNIWEWTMESYFTGFRVRRGGSYGSAGSDSPASVRGSNYPYISDSFRRFSSHFIFEGLNAKAVN